MEEMLERIMSLEEKIARTAGVEESEIDEDSG
jgi:hypothetical protein